MLSKDPDKASQEKRRQHTPNVESSSRNGPVVSIGKQEKIGRRASHLPQLPVTSG